MSSSSSQDSSSYTMDIVSPPEAVRGMTELDRTKFVKKFITSSLIVKPLDVSKLTKPPFKNNLISIRGLRPVIAAQDKRALILDPHKFSSVEQAETLLKPLLNSAQIEDYKFDLEEVELRYANWSAEEILKGIFPHNVTPVTGFSVVGHMAHLNLRDEHSPYKKLIGEVLLDKHKHIQSVVNKTDNIHNTYRNFTMELLAGRDDTNVTVKENGCTYQFDFAKVYWNSRLGTEHERIVKRLPAGAIVHDVFAGVGPFAVPAAKMGFTVLANDLNPCSYQYLKSNMVKNRVKGKYSAHNMDGREFIREIIRKSFTDHQNDNDPLVVIMNLPAIAITFLDAFINLMNRDSSYSRPPPVIYCYNFSKAPTVSYEEDIANQVNVIFNSDIVTPAMVRKVRNVAPNKEMMCAEFTLPWSVMQCNGPVSKKAKTDDADDVKSLIE